MTLPKYHSFPPLTPHKPTPTIPQMEDLLERQAFAYEAMAWLHWATCAIGGVVMTVLIASLLFRAIVGVY
jgi:hypothetical protein